MHLHGSLPTHRRPIHSLLFFRWFLCRGKNNNNKTTPKRKNIRMYLGFSGGERWRNWPRNTRCIRLRAYLFHCFLKWTKLDQFFQCCLCRVSGQTQSSPYLHFNFHRSLFGLLSVYGCVCVCVWILKSRIYPRKYNSKIVPHLRQVCHTFLRCDIENCVDLHQCYTISVVKFH